MFMFKYKADKSSNVDATAYSANGTSKYIAPYVCARKKTLSTVSMSSSSRYLDFSSHNPYLA